MKISRRGGAAGVLLLIFLIGVLAGSLYFLYLNLPGEEVGLKPVNGEGLGSEDSKAIDSGEVEESKQFYPNMRFPERRISYHISENCNEKKISEANEALSILESKTILIFYPESEVNAEIRILCSELAPEPDQEGYFIAGEGGPTKVINAGLYSVIFEGKLSLYREDKCDDTRVALHELLHVLGFDHNNDPGSILYPTLNCNQKLDNYIVDEINNLYKEDKFSDLKIDKIEATKSGSYLNFKIEVLNQGLAIASDVKLTAYADDKKVEFENKEYFDFGEIEVGTRKVLTIDNLRIPRSTKKVTFIVDEENRVQELFEDNNKVVLEVDG